MSYDYAYDCSIRLEYHASGTDYRACLRKAVEEKIDKMGKVILPTETGVKVREITDTDLAMDFIDQICVSKLSSLGLVEPIGPKSGAKSVDKS